MNDCIFCKIARDEIKANVVFSDASVVAFRDINPQAPVHILVIPKKHVERISTLTEEDFSLVTDIHRAIQQVVKAENLETSGFRVVTNDGPSAGQTVPHLHYHILGGRRLTWPPG